MPCDKCNTSAKTWSCGKANCGEKICDACFEYNGWASCKYCNTKLCGSHYAYCGVCDGNACETCLEKRWPLCRICDSYNCENCTKDGTCGSCAGGMKKTVKVGPEA